MFYERKLSSIPALIEEAGSMDADAGLRVVGRYKGKSCYVFVTRFEGTYTAMVYHKGGKGRAIGRRLAVEELSGTGKLESMLRKIVPRKVVAFAY